jgi:glutamine cyclotransferase
MMDERHFVEGLEFFNTTHMILSDGYWGSSKIAYLGVTYPPSNNYYGYIGMTKDTVLGSTIFGEGCTSFNNSIY